MQIFPRACSILPVVLSSLVAGHATAGQDAVIHSLAAQPATEPAAQVRWHGLPAPGVPEPGSIVQTSLPDGGPRFERSGNDPAMVLFEQAVAAYDRREIQAAVSQFEEFLRQHPQHDAAPAARAFLAESILLSPAAQPRRVAVIDAYRVLGREAASSTNGKRAAWRMGDLYRELGWYQESELAYQQALGRAEADSYDRSRALVGLGFTLLGRGKWTDAQKTFDLARKQTTDPHLLAHASIGAGHALYRQGKIAEADQLYAMASGRWGTVFRRQPYALIRYANTSLTLAHTQNARRLLLQFYNLYPSRPEAPEALLQVADSFQAAEQLDEAKLFYAAVAARYPASDEGAIAQIRLIRLSGEHTGESWRELPEALVQSLFLGLPLDVVNPENPAQWLEDTAAKYAQSGIGSEALFRLGEFKQQAGHTDEALQVYERVARRAGLINGDPWPDTAGTRLMTLLRPSLEAAVQSKDDLTAVGIFHRHGPQAARLYGGDPLLFSVADAHARLGFAIEAARLYQAIIRNPQSGEALEPALIGLGISYLDQQDPQAAQRVFERYRLQFPLGQYADQALSLLLRSMTQQGDYGNVVRLGRRWLRNHPKAEARKEVLAHIGLALAELHRPEQALPVLEEGYRLGGLVTPEALAVYGDLLSMAKHHEQAVALYERSLAVNPPRDLAAWDRMQIARNLREARRPEQARAVLETLDADDQPLFQRVAAVLERDLETGSRMQRRRP